MKLESKMKLKALDICSVIFWLVVAALFYCWQSGYFEDTNQILLTLFQGLLFLFYVWLRWRLVGIKSAIYKRKRYHS